MELVDGPTLADRIAGGPIPVDEALPIARQIAEALEAAHERGVIHRDLKPANIKLTPSGQVKVLDFGLAKLAGPPEGGPYVPAGGAGFSRPDISMSPTLTVQATLAGVILGTAAYMSPEQARGKPVDQRGDIWAFGCVLYEMLTGRRAFEGEDVSQTMARVIEREPDLTAVPVHVRRLLKACLEKDRRKRLHAIGDVHLLLESAAPPPTVAPRPRLAMAGWIVGAAATVFAVALAVIHFRETPVESPTVRSTLLAPGNATFNADFTEGVGLHALSPDGKRIVFGARDADGRTPLWVRSLDALTAQPLAGTDGARFPFWSPDGRFVAFFADGKLKKIEASGGPVLTLTDAPSGRGGSWNRDGVIIFAPSTTNDTPMLRVSSAGGASTSVTGIQGSFPWFLPDGLHFVYQSGGLLARQPGGNQPEIRIGGLDGSSSKALGRGSNALYSQGHILFVREATLMALPFDPDRLASTGEAVPVAERIQGVLNSGRAAAFSVSETGLLAYREGAGPGGYTPTWMDRNGVKGAGIGNPSNITDLALSPDRKSIAVVVQENNFDIWVYDVARQLRTRLTFDAANDMAPVWSPDGRSIVFRSNRKGHYDLYRKAVDSAGTEELLYADDLDKIPTSWSPDGRLLLYEATGRGRDLWILPLTPEHAGAPLKPVLLLQTPFNEGLAQFSPDGRWILYMSDESQRPEIYAAPFALPGGLSGKRQISGAGGVTAGLGILRWRRDGREVFFVSADRQVIATEISINGDNLDVGVTRRLFDLQNPLRLSFDVSADGQRFILLTTADEKSVAPITLVQNWAAGLTK
jgi:Tol biopolymer transport system component